MKKERIKNIMLTFLVIINVILGAKILTNKKLWSSDYNFFSEKNFPILRFFKKSSGSENRIFENSHRLTEPQKIIFNTGDQATRFSLLPNAQTYFDTINQCDKIILAALSAGKDNISEATQDEWFSSLKTKSLYMNYHTEYDLSLFAKFFGTHETFLSEYVSTFSNVVITLSDNVTVYVEDLSSEKYYKIKTGRKFEDFKEFTQEIIDKTVQKNLEGNAVNYSFELNFDKAFGNQKTIIASLVPISSVLQTFPIVKVSSSIENEYEIGSITNNIAHVFNVNTNAAKRYTESDGTVVYVENNAILKIHPDGLLEYKALDDRILLSESSEYYNTVLKLNDFVSQVNTAADIDDDIFLSSPLSKDISEITFDYSCEGIPVDISISDMSHAVSCAISDGYLREYRQILRNYKNCGESAVVPEYINAVDDTIQKYSDVTEEITINKLYLAYKDNGTDFLLSPDWKTEVQAVILKE